MGRGAARGTALARARWWIPGPHGGWRGAPAAPRCRSRPRDRAPRCVWLPAPHGREGTGRRASAGPHAAPPRGRQAGVPRPVGGAAAAAGGTGDGRVAAGSAAPLSACPLAPTPSKPLPPVRAFSPAAAACPSVRFSRVRAARGPATRARRAAGSAAASRPRGHLPLARLAAVHRGLLDRPPPRGQRRQGCIVSAAAPVWAAGAAAADAAAAANRPASPPAERGARRARGRRAPPSPQAPGAAAAPVRRDERLWRSLTRSRHSCRGAQGREASLALPPKRAPARNTERVCRSMLAS
jgi:hypothetical protein